MRGPAGAPRSLFPLRLFAMVALGATVTVAGPARADDTQPPRFTLISQIDPATGSRNNSDIWGWVDPATNKEYAIMGEWGGNRVYIVDVSDPTNPTLTSTITPTPGQDIKTWGNYLYTVDGDGNGADGKIWDISDPTLPVFVGYLESGHNLNIVDGYLYKSVPGMRIFDLNNTPATPQLVWWDGLSVTRGHDSTVQGNILYDFNGIGGVAMYDVTNKTNPQLIGGLPQGAGGIAYCHNGAPSPDGRYLYVTDELGQATAADITVWDISAPQSPVLVNGFTDPNATVHNLFVLGNRLFVSFYVAGVRAFDISDPANPVLLDTYDTSPAYTGNNLYNGCWGIYPYAPSGVIYASDIENGLFLFSFPGVTVAVAISSFDAVFDAGDVHLRWQIAGADGLQGFRIYRSEMEEKGYVALNPLLLPPDGEYRYTDHDVRPGKTYWYRLGAVDRDGEFLSQTQKVVIPEPVFVLEQNHPNPFNPTTTIDYVLSKDGHVSLAVFNTAGQLIRTLVDGTQSAGPHSTTWDGTIRAGGRAASGVYFYRLAAAGRVETRRMILLK